jgi:hypothetical protein
MPDPLTLLAGLHAGGPELRVERAAGGAAVRLCAAYGRALVAVEAPCLVQVPGEAARLLGPDMACDAPFWWTEVRAVTSVEEAGRLAGSVAGRLTAVLGGATWPRDVAHTGVVTVPPAGIPEDQASPDAPDIVTDRAAVVLQDRPVIAATTWLTHALRTATATGRELQIVTPPGARLTMPTRGLLTRLPSRWVVRDPGDGYYDGLTGAVLHWHEGRFTPVAVAEESGSTASAFDGPHTAGDDGEKQLVLSIRTTHPADEHLLLGGALEAACVALTGVAPLGWSTAEPVNLPWSTRQLTELARARARRSAATWLVAVGDPARPAIATLRVAHTPAGIEEHVGLAVGYSSGRALPVDAVTGLAEILATRHGLTSMHVHRRAAPAELTIRPRREAPATPVAFTLGPDAVQAAGRAAAEGVADPRPLRLGPASRPALHYAFAAADEGRARQQLRRVSAPRVSAPPA